MERCTAAGIAVFNAAGANAEAVKELTICGLLLASRDIAGGLSWIRFITGEEDIPAAVEKGKSNFVGPEINGKTLGIVGLGAIGTMVANAAVALGMKVWGYDPYLSVDAAWRLRSEVMHAPDMDTIYRQSDYITLHLQCNDETKGMINAGTIAKMKPGVRILNFARGALVKDDDILSALSVGKVARYVTDFPNNKLAGAAGVVALPHLGASTPESEEKCAVMAARELVDYLKNGNTKNSVNLPNLSLERSGEARLCVIHRNVPRVLNRILEVIGGENINVEHMISKPRGEIAYTIIDTGSPLSEDLAVKIRGMMEVMRVRVL